MNRKIIGIALLGLAVSIGAAYAYPGAGNGVQRTNFVDVDGDGICDNSQSGQCHGYGNGSRNGYRNGCGNDCSGFVDEDGDGICDNCQSTCGQGYQNGNRRGRGQP
jgi:hypothetical protein